MRGARFRPYRIPADHLRHTRGRPPVEAARCFLRARRIGLPNDDVRRIAARHEELFLARLRRRGVAPYRSGVAAVRAVRARGIATAAVSPYRNTADLLTRAGVADLFDVRVGHADAVRIGFNGGSDPALSLEVTRRLGSPPGSAAVIEDTPSGVRAARRAGFGLVIGVDRAGDRAALDAQGAHLVVADLSELRLTTGALLWRPTGVT